MPANTAAENHNAVSPLPGSSCLSPVSAGSISEKNAAASITPAAVFNIRLMSSFE